MDDGGGFPVIEALLSVASLLCSICGCIAWCNQRSARGGSSSSRSNGRERASTATSLRAPLVSHTVEQDRVQVSFRHAAEGHTTCAFCGFANLKRFLFCRLCTKALARHDKTKTSSTTATAANTKDDAYEQLYIKESQRPLRTFNVRQRQVRAKLRTEWQRKVDVDGGLFWYRDDVGGFNASAMRFPGYALRFEIHEDFSAHDKPSTSGGSSKVVIETPLSKGQVVEKLSFEVVFASLQLIESSLANPAHIPVEDGHHGSLQWLQVLALAEQNFLTKYACFATAAAGCLIPANERLLRLTISRGSLLEDSMESLAVIPRGSIHAALDVSFIGDTAISSLQHTSSSSSGDTPARRYQEWFTFLSHQLAEPAFGVFRGITNTEQTFYLNANSLHAIGEQHLMYYFATGRLIGRALLEGQVLGFHLALPLLKVMLGLPVSFNDLEYVDPEAYKSLLALLIDDGGAETKDLYFSVEESFAVDSGDEEDNGSDSKATHVVDLVPDGHTVKVTELNKDEYLNRMFRYTLFESVSSQLYAFLKGLYEVVPQELLMLFDPEELDYLLCGSDEINIVAWKRKRHSQSRQRSNSIDPEDVIEVAEHALNITSMIFDM